MKNMPKRDITGECVGECRDTVREAEEKRQMEIDSITVESTRSFPSARSAFSRDEAPGYLGGHI